VGIPPSALLAGTPGRILAAPAAHQLSADWLSPRCERGDLNPHESYPTGTRNRGGGDATERKHARSLRQKASKPSTDVTIRAAATRTFGTTAPSASASASVVAPRGGVHSPERVVGTSQAWQVNGCVSSTDSCGSSWPSEAVAATLTSIRPVRTWPMGRWPMDKVAPIFPVTRPPEPWLPPRAKTIPLAR
jgi:hypothetical protein